MQNKPFVRALRIPVAFMLSVAIFAYIFVLSSEVKQGRVWNQGLFLTANSFKPFFFPQFPLLV